ncbi:MAG: ABC transporter substrate-binding protein [Ignavibacteria bacterium]|jgi:branched-chain amino acid transport system substrate-binding protein
MKKFISFLFLTIFLVSCSSEPDQIKLGSILPLTGDAASWGNPVKNSVQMAVDEINNSGGINGKLLNVVFEDSQAEPSKGVSAIQKLITQDKPIAIIGAVASSVSIAIAPFAEKNKIPVISPASTSPKLTGISKYFFRVIPTDKLRAEKFAEYIYSKGFEELDIVFINNEGGSGAKEAFVKKYNELGGNVTLNEGYTQGTNDFRAVLNKSKNSDSNAL